MGSTVEASGYARGRLTARPRPDLPDDVLRGEHVPASDAGWQGVLFVPESYNPLRPAPLMLTLHGATGNGERMLARWRETAARHGVVVLAPSSRDRTWDVLTLGYGHDVASIDHALAEAFATLNVDAGRLYIEGFSDGASYALSLGLANGDLFTHVIANSPGFFTVPSRVGEPRFLFTHGTQDTVLPISRCSRLIVPQFERAGYDVTYHEFEGGHSLTPEIMTLSLEWAGAPALPEPG